MAQINSIVLADGQTTPANKTFDVFNAQYGQEKPAMWQEKTAGSFAGFKQLSLLVKRSGSGKSTKVTALITDPTLAVTAPASGTGIQPSPVAAYTVIGKIEFTLPDDCSLQNRKDILAYVKNLMSNAILADAVHNLSPAY